MSIKGIGVIAIIGVVIIVTGLLSTETWNPSWNPFISVPSSVVGDAFSGLIEAKSFKTQGSLKLDIQAQIEDSMQNIGVELTFIDETNKSDLDDVRSKGEMDITVSAEGMNFSASLEDIVVNKTLYLKVISLPALLPLPINLEDIKGIWFSLDTKAMDEALGTEQVYEIKDIFEVLEKSIAGKELFKIEEDYGEGHYLVSLNKKAVKEIGSEMFEAVREYVPEEQKESFETSVTEFPSNLDQAWAKLRGIEFEVWIDKTIQRLKWEKTLELGSMEALESQIEEGSISILFDISFSDLNKNFDIEAPESATPLEEILSSLFSSFVVPEME